MIIINMLIFQNYKFYIRGTIILYSDDSVAKKEFYLFYKMCVCESGEIKVEQYKYKMESQQLQREAAEGECVGTMVWL